MMIKESFMNKKGIVTAVTAALLCLMTMPVSAGTWQQENSAWSYYDQNGAQMTGWIRDQGNWYYLRDTGEMATGWLEYEENRYYLYDSGDMATDWVKIEGNWYYFHSNGTMAHDTWIKNYYVNSSGKWVKSK